MADPATDERVEPRPLVFHPQQPPRLLRRIVDRLFDVVLLVLVVALLLGGDLSPLLIIAVVALGIGWTLRLAEWAARRRDPDPRPTPSEIVLSASLVGRVRSLQRQDRRAEAAKLLQGETDLSLTDTARALELVRNSGPAS